MPDDQTKSNSEKDVSVLITGGSGFISKQLTASLLASGYKVSHLSRNRSRSGEVKSFMWSPEKGIIDPEVFEGLDFIIHLAGANIGSKRWSRSRKEQIIASRVDSARFLYRTILEKGIRLKAFISASATGIYGSLTSPEIYSENDTSAADFLGNVCKQWETAADLFNNTALRTVKIRTAVVLAKNKGALSKLMIPAKFGFLVQTGIGRQYMPWIHIDDLCNIYLKAISDSGMQGAYNAVAPQHVTHKDFIHTLAKAMKLPVLPVPVPGFVLRIALGKMADVILKGSRVSSGKILKAGYRFQFNTLENALQDLI